MISFARQAIASRGILLLSGVSQGEAEAVARAASAIPVPGLDLLTAEDVGRGFQPDRRFGEGVVNEAFDDDGGQKGEVNGKCSTHQTYLPSLFSRSINASQIP